MHDLRGLGQESGHVVALGFLNWDQRGERISVSKRRKGKDRQTVLDG